MASPIADLVIRISADSADFQNNLRNTEAWAKTFGKNIDTSFVGIAKASAAMATAVFASTGAIVVAFANMADQALKTAGSLDMGVEALSRLRFAADLSGSSAGAMDAALVKMQRSIGDATMGSGEAAKALKDLGLNAQQLAAMGPEQAFLTIADSLNRVEDSSQRAALGADIFGKQFSDPSSGIANVVAQGSEAIAEMGAELDNLGGTLQSDIAAESERYNDHVTRMEAVSTGFAQQLSGAVLPTINLMAEDMIKAAKESETLSMTAEALGIAFKSVVTAGISVKWVLGTVIDFLGAIGIAMSRLISRDFEGAASAFTEFGEDRQKQAEHDASRIIDVWTSVPGEIERGTRGKGKGSGIIVADRQAALEAAKERERLAKQLQAQADGMQTQHDQLQSQLEMREALYQESFEKGLLSEEQKNNLILAARQDYWARILELDQQGVDRQRQIDKQAQADRLAAQRKQLDDVYTLNNAIAEAVLKLKQWEILTEQQKYSALADMAQTALNAHSQTSKKAFEASKALAIATTIINTYRAAMAAFASLAETNYYLAVAAAVATVAYGLAQVNAIRATEYGGGGGAPAFSAPTAAGDVGGGGFSTGSRQSPNITIVVQDDALLSGATVRRIVEGINESLEDGGEITIAGSGY
jgi:hypothetical protein